MKTAWFARKDGSQFWGSISLNKLKNDVGSYLGHLLIIKDLTIQKNYEDTLRSEIELAHQCLQLKSQNTLLI